MSCGYSWVHLQPELLRVAPFQKIRINAEVHLDYALDYDGDKGWTQTDFHILNPRTGAIETINKQSGFDFVKAAPGIYHVAVIVTNNAKTCRQLQDNVSIEVMGGSSPPGSDGCTAGYHKDNTGTCVLNSCPAGTQPDQYGNCIENPPIPCTKGYHLDGDGKSCVKDACDIGFHVSSDGQTCEVTDHSVSCPNGLYNSNGYCLPVPIQSTPTPNYVPVGGGNKPPATTPVQQSVDTNLILLGVVALAGLTIIMVSNPANNSQIIRRF
jgi:hypothetical protein